VDNTFDFHASHANISPRTWRQKTSPLFVAFVSATLNLDLKTYLTRTKPLVNILFLTAIPRLEAPYFHIAVRKVDWGNRLLQFYCVNWSTKSCFSILLYSREICCGSFSHAPSAAFIGIGSTVHSIHPILVRPAAVTRGPAWCSGKPLNQPT
jgi:hypothetical protein